jgi:hypothetical protein
MLEEMRLEAIDAITSAMEKHCMIEQTVGPSRHYDVSVCSQVFLCCPTAYAVEHQTIFTANIM